jgi:sugar phosphate isomerase/epimerase
MCTGIHTELCADEENELQQTGTGRRSLLKGAAAAVAGAATVGVTGALGAPASAVESSDEGQGALHRVPPSRISIQMYTVRDAAAADLPGTLEALRDIGYRRIETAGFYGLTPAQFKAELDRVGIRATSNHIGIPQPFDAAAWSEALDAAVLLGSWFINHPFFGYDFAGSGAEREASVWAAFARDLNKAGKMARARGIRLGYHNHHHEFLPVAGSNARRLTAYDVLERTIDPRYVHLQMDLFWVTRGAHDPVDEIREARTLYNLDVPQFHVKDMSATFDPGIPFEDPGRGLIDFGRIFRLAPLADTREWIVERDDAGVAPRTPEMSLDTARVGYEFLRNIRF